MKPKIGLEVHIYVRTASKLFCECSSDFLDASPTTNVCAVCTAQPGAKPMAPNGAALTAAIRLARAAQMQFPSHARFLRKHYFYPDSPANYQRTSQPIATGGALNGVALTELHVEEDPGAYDPATGLVDDNRAGVSLIEFVTDPVMSSADEARAFLRELRLTLEYLGISNRAAGVKADCNVSLIHDDGSNGPRVELKNVNGFRNVERAVEAEIERQLAQVSSGEEIHRETRGFDEMTARSVRLRGKESVADYRYLPDPDVRPVDVGALVRDTPVEVTPAARRESLCALTGASAEDIAPLLEDPAFADALEALAAAGIDAGVAHRFLLRDVRGDLEMRGLTFAGSALTVERIRLLLNARETGKLTPHQTTRLLRLALDGGDLEAALDSEAGAKVDDLEADARAVLVENEKAVADYRGGKAAALHFLVGALMKRTKGRAPIEEARAAIVRALEAA